MEHGVSKGLRIQQITNEQRSEAKVHREETHVQKNSCSEEQYKIETPDRG